MEALAIHQNQNKTTNPTRRPHRSKDGQSAEVRAVLHRSNLQAKLRVGQPNDQYEKEADNAAKQVVAEFLRAKNSFQENQPDRYSSQNDKSASTSLLQRQPVKSQKFLSLKSTALDVQHLSTNKEEELRLKHNEEMEEHLPGDDFSPNYPSIDRSLATDIAAILNGKREERNWRRKTVAAGNMLKRKAYGKTFWTIVIATCLAQAGYGWLGVLKLTSIF